MLVKRYKPNVLSILVPVEPFNVIFSVLVELADAAVDVLWDAI